MDRKEDRRISHERSTVQEGTLNKIRKRKATFVRHVMKKKEMEHHVTTGTMEGKRERGRPRMKMLLSLAEWSGQLNEIELLRLTNYRHKWKTMVANAGMHGTR